MKALLIDFGSTFTKIVIVDLYKQRILAQSKAPTTIDNITIGLTNALKHIGMKLDDIEKPIYEYKLACSSAAGGLKIICIGLVPRYSAEAAKRAALTAGGKVIGVYSFKLNIKEIEEIQRKKPDIILLSGGTDGGDEKTIKFNARLLAKSQINCPIIVAGNKEAADYVEKVLKERGKEVYITENIMPQLGKLNIQPVNETIRNIFLKRIVEAKGLDVVRRYVDVLMPTPAASLNATVLLSNGVGHDKGLGEIMVIEVGGATTNVYSVAKGIYSSTILYKGLEEPHVKRTVEGDLGVRFNAESIINNIGEHVIIRFIHEAINNGGTININLTEHINILGKQTSYLPKDDISYAIDESLARAAVKLAVERHVGKLNEIWTPRGLVYIQSGKDFRKVKYVVGTGGPIVYAKNPARILAESLYNRDIPHILKPENPQLLIDSKYVLWAMGLLSDVEPNLAFKILKSSLKVINYNSLR